MEEIKSKIVKELEEYLSTHDIYEEMKAGEEACYKMQQSKIALVIYHKEDNDGVFSGAIVYRYLAEFLHFNPQNIHLLGSTYASLDEISKNGKIDTWKDKYNEVIMVDISFNNANVMKKLLSDFGCGFIWIDHHAPIIKRSYQEGFSDIEGMRDISHSALYLTYQYFYDPFKMSVDEYPELLNVLSSYDAWTWEKEGRPFKHVSTINKAVTFVTKLDIKYVLNILYGLYDINGNDISTTSMDKFYSIGEVLNDYDNTLNELLMQNNAEYGWDVNGRSGVAIFKQGPSNSTMFESVKDKAQVGIVFKKVPDKNQWTMSLYNTKDEYSAEFHCGEYLQKKYNGGGHAGAAGCTISSVMFNKMLKEKKI